MYFVRTSNCKIVLFLIPRIAKVKENIYLKLKIIYLASDLPRLLSLDIYIYSSHIKVSALHTSFSHACISLVICAREAVLPVPTGPAIYTLWGDLFFVAFMRLSRNKLHSCITNGERKSSKSSFVRKLKFETHSIGKNSYAGNVEK